MAWGRPKEVIEKYGEEYVCNAGVIRSPKPNDFCSHAEPRRRSDIDGNS